jgi:tRNA G18 (ribose-2'-O)-methylase SpoU
VTTHVIVESADDPRLAPFRFDERALASRAERRDDRGAGLFLAEGDLVVERALDAGCVPVAALADPQRIPPVVERLGIEVFLAGDDVRRMVTRLGIPHPVVALFRRPPRPSVAELVAASERLVVLEGVDNPANVGAVVRNAAALGWHGLILDHTSADPLSRRALRVAMGTAFTLPHARTQTLRDDLAALGSHTLVALTPDPSATPIDQVTIRGPRAVLIGSERAGLGPDLLEVAHLRVRIPMWGGVDSLNAAAATAIACHSLRK